jgi:hypothetical protein
MKTVMTKTTISNSFLVIQSFEDIANFFVLQFGDHLEKSSPVIITNNLEFYFVSISFSKSTIKKCV